MKFNVGDKIIINPDKLIYRSINHQCLSKGKSLDPYEECAKCEAAKSRILVVKYIRDNISLVVGCPVEDFIVWKSECKLFRDWEEI